MDGIRRHRREFEAAGERAQELRTLPPETIQTVRDMGMFWLKTPAELAGTPLAPLDFCDVLEELAYTDSSTAWTVMVGNGGTGTAGGWLPDAGARRVFAPGRPLPLVVGTPGPRGTGRAVAGGESVRDLFRYGGGRVLSLSSLIQRYLRDALAARQHIGVSEENYERAGRDRIRRFAGRLAVC